MFYVLPYLGVHILLLMSFYILGSRVGVFFFSFFCCLEQKGEDQAYGIFMETAQGDDIA